MTRIPFIFSFTLLLYMLSACTFEDIPGRDSRIRHYSVQHSGVATITRVYIKDSQTFIDLLWQAKNNIGDPEAYKQINTNEIRSFDHSKKVKTDDKVYFNVTHFFKQRGSTTPELKKSSWTMSK